MSGGADWQVHRRPVDPPELAYFAFECDSRSDHLSQLGRRQEASELAQLGLQLVQLARLDRPVTLALLYSPSTGAVRLVGELRRGGRELAGVKPFDCGASCGCRKLVLEPTVKAIVRGAV